MRHICRPLCLFTLGRHGNFTAGVTSEQPDLLCTAIALNIELLSIIVCAVFLNKLMLDPVSQSVIIQLMTFDEVNTRNDQPMEHNIHRGIRGEYHVPWVDQSLYSLKLKVIVYFHGRTCIMHREFMASLFPTRYINAKTIIIMLNILYKTT
jgi:hypothetical protein